MTLYKFPRISIIIPTLGREEKLARLVKELKLSKYPDFEIIVMQDTFENRQGVPKMLKQGVEKSNGELVMYLGNDCVPQPNFMELAVIQMNKSFPKMDGMIGLNDMIWGSDKAATHWLISKKLLPVLGGEFFHTGYHHTYCDDELTERCRALGKYVWCEEAMIYHDHPIQHNGQVEVDEVYTLAYQPQDMRDDQELFKKRAKEFGFKVRERIFTSRRYPKTKEVVDLRNMISNVENMKVLNVGVGSMQSDIARQLPFFNFKRLDHLDVHKPYITEGKKIIWNALKTKFINKDMREFHNWNKYSLVMIFDVLEHLKKEESLKIIDEIKTELLIFIPLEKQFRENDFGVEAQDHLSLWTEEDFKKLGFDTILLANFHRDKNGPWDALWAHRAKK